MNVFVYRSTAEPDLFIVTDNPSRATLPRNHEPWRFWRWTQLDPALMGINMVEADADLKARGYHLWRGV
jgi:hypothetical protein